jgi:acetyltransferase-like isoleucine patch superfamily enzyme
MKRFLMAVSIFFPWGIRRLILQSLFGYQIHPTSRIGFAYVLPKMLVMEAHSRIGHFTVCKGLDLLQLKQHSAIGRGNWISGFPSGSSVHFTHQKDRKPQLIVGEHSAITHRHIIDCTNSVIIGKFSTIAGYGSQILTHSIDLEKSRQSSLPVEMGNYCFIGTNSVILGGSSLPDYSVLGAKSLLNKRFSDTHYLYAGVSARPVKELSADLLYFSRKVGFVK